MNEIEKVDPWENRSEGMCCKTCMWFLEKRKNSLATNKLEELMEEADNRIIITHKPKLKIGRCRRHAPTMSGYPVVYSNDFCGDHKVDENKIGE